VVPPLGCCRQMDHQQGFLSTAISCFSQSQQTFTLTTPTKGFVFSFKNLIQYLIKLSRYVSSFLKDNHLSLKEERKGRTLEKAIG